MVHAKEVPWPSLEKRRAESQSGEGEEKESGMLLSLIRRGKIAPWVKAKVWRMG